MGYCCSKPDQVLADPTTSERDPLVSSRTTTSTRVELIASTPVPPPPPLHDSDHEDEDPAIPVTSYYFLNRDEDHGIRYPKDIQVSQIQEIFVNIHELYINNALVNIQKVDECLRHFKAILQVDKRLHMEECFQTWRSRITKPVFKVTLTDSNSNIKEITVRGENIPREIWEAQKFIRELLYGCQMFLDQHQFFQESIQTGIWKIQNLLQDPSLFKTMQHTQRVNIEEDCRRLLQEYEPIIGKLSWFYGNIERLMTEIKESVNVLA